MSDELSKERGRKAEESVKGVEGQARPNRQGSQDDLPHTSLSTAWKVKSRVKLYGVEVCGGANVPDLPISSTFCGREEKSRRE